MTEYRRIIVEDEVFGALAAISIDGPKGVGKTATGARRDGSLVVQVR